MAEPCEPVAIRIVILSRAIPIPSSQPKIGGNSFRFGTGRVISHTETRTASGGLTRPGLGIQSAFSIAFRESLRGTANRASSSR